MPVLESFEEAAPTDFITVVNKNIDALGYDEEDEEVDPDNQDRTSDVEEVEGKPQEEEEEKPKPKVDDAGDDKGKSKEDDDDEEEFDAPETTAELAEALGISEEKLLGIKTKFKAAGSDEEKTLSEVVQGFQREADYTRNKQALSAAQSEFEQGQRERVEEYRKAATIVSQQLNTAHRAAAARLESPEMAALRLSDPNEYLIKAREIDQEIQGVGQQRQQMATQYDSYMSNQKLARLKAEGDKLRKADSSFTDDTLREGLEVLRSFGYTDQELEYVMDARMVQGALEVKSLREENNSLKDRIKKGAEVAKKVKKTVPLKQVMKPTGKRKTQRKGLSAARERFGKNRDLHSAAAVFEGIEDL